MIKLIELLLVGSLVCKLLAGRWPWQTAAAARGRDDTAEVARARGLLGVGAQAAREDIIDAHRRLILAVHPDRGGSNALAHEANTARDLLLNEITRHRQGQA